MDAGETAVCAECKEDVYLIDTGRRRRTNIPVWLRCSLCSDVYHSECAKVPTSCTRIENYEWECNDCKQCFICMNRDSDGMMFCDGCDRGCHGRCLTPKVEVTNGDERPFMCQECLENKHTTRGFRRVKILGAEPKRPLVQKRDSSETGPKRSKRMRAERKQRHSRSLDREQDSSADEEEHLYRGDPPPHTCVARGCDGTGNLDGKSPLHFTLDTCPVYHHINPEIVTDILPAVDSYLTGKKTMTKAARETIDRLNGLADQRMATRSSGTKIRKPNDVFVAPTIHGVSEFGKMLYEMSKVNLATSKNEQQQPAGKPKRFVSQVQVGKYIVEVDDFSATCRDEPLRKEVFFCDVCLNLSFDSTQFERHVVTCSATHPPGAEVYSKNDVAVYEVDGMEHKEFCQNLSLLSRFFLNTKAVCYDVLYMMYYVLVQKDEDGTHKIVGYFSKDKDLMKNTLACILVLPQFEHQGFGKLLIDLSYVIARTTKRPGTPERPLSRPGLQAFTSYWRCVVSRSLLSHCDKHSDFDELMEVMTQDLGMAREDIEDTLVRLDLIKTDPKTKRYVLLIKPSVEALKANSQKCSEWLKSHRIIDRKHVKQNWLKVLPNRKQPE